MKWTKATTIKASSSMTVIELFSFQKDVLRSFKHKEDGSLFMFYKVLFIAGREVPACFE